MVSFHCWLESKVQRFSPSSAKYAPWGTVENDIDMDKQLMRRRKAIVKDVVEFIHEVGIDDDDVALEMLMDEIAKMRRYVKKVV